MLGRSLGGRGSRAGSGWAALWRRPSSGRPGQAVAEAGGRGGIARGILGRRPEGVSRERETVLCEPGAEAGGE